MIEAVKTRLADQVATLKDRIDGAADFAELMRKNQLPQVTPAAFILPLGLRGARAEASTGAFVQDVTETIGVLLVLRTHSGTGDRALPELDALIASVIAALAGWAPGDETGVFTLTRGQLVNMQAGTIVYQLDFAINDQLRILS